MRVIARKTLRRFWETPEFADAEHSLRAWYKFAVEADWRRPSDVKADFRNASFVGDNRIVFNIDGNKYRLVVRVNYPYHVVYIRFVGTHEEYDGIDARAV
ncbi:MAG TPA: type II toxin-antitoxin system HigB family toxin [Pirellulales bacterium]|nr:type II toxin-antitoxin system HigB family toxin [Pirellulales bacterium]